MYIYGYVKQRSEKEVLEKLQSDKEILSKSRIDIKKYFIKQHRFSRDICPCLYHSIFLFIIIQMLYFKLENSYCKNKKQVKNILKNLINSYKQLQEQKCIAKQIYSMYINLSLIEILNKDNIIAYIFKIILKQHV